MIPQQALINDALSPHTPPPFPADADATVTGTDIISLADLQPQPVEWLWQHRLAAGTLAMLSGKPGSGKTWVALAIAAALTRGRDPFTGEELKPATVLYASAEHAAAQIIQPRFAGLHGDPARLVILRRAVSANSMSSPDSALRDLEHALEKTQAHLVILDPWDGLCEADLDRASQTRPLLDRLARLAELHHCCILLIRHLAKPTAGRPAHRGRASIECSAAHPHRVSRRQLARRTRANRSAARQIEPWAAGSAARLPDWRSRQFPLDWAQQPHPGGSPRRPSHRRRSAQAQVCRPMAA